MIHKPLYRIAKAWDMLRDVRIIVLTCLLFNLSVRMINVSGASDQDTNPTDVEQTLCCLSDGTPSFGKCPPRNGRCCVTIGIKFSERTDSMAFSEYNRRKFVAGMTRRIAQLRDQSEKSLDFAIETMFQERTDAYLYVEQGLIEVDRMLGLVEGELEEITELTAAQRLESRLEFIEDRFEEFESEIRQRPRRRRRKINLFNFFKAAGGAGSAGGDGEGTSARGEIRSSVQAYEVLGVEFGSPLPVVTRAFRERAKKIHPDIRQGDRSAEPELRRIIEAYQFLKTDYFGNSTSDSFQRPF
jgi:hypothetical protein